MPSSDAPPTHVLLLPAPTFGLGGDESLPIKLCGGFVLPRSTLVRPWFFKACLFLLCITVVLLKDDPGPSLRRVREEVERWRAGATQEISGSESLSLPPNIQSMPSFCPHRGFSSNIKFGLYSFICLLLILLTCHELYAPLFFQFCLRRLEVWALFLLVIRRQIAMLAEAGACGVWAKNPGISSEGEIRSLFALLAAITGGVLGVIWIACSDALQTNRKSKVVAVCLSGLFLLQDYLRRLRILKGLFSMDPKIPEDAQPIPGTDAYNAAVADKAGVARGEAVYRWWFNSDGWRPVDPGSGEVIKKGPVVFPGNTTKIFSEKNSEIYHDPAWYQSLPGSAPSEIFHPQHPYLSYFPPVRPEDVPARKNVYFWPFELSWCEHVLSSDSLLMLYAANILYQYWKGEDFFMVSMRLRRVAVARPSREEKEEGFKFEDDDDTAIMPMVDSEPVAAQFLPGMVQDPSTGNGDESGLERGPVIETERNSPSPQSGSPLPVQTSQYRSPGGAEMNSQSDSPGGLELSSKPVLALSESAKLKGSGIGEIIIGEQNSSGSQRPKKLNTGGSLVHETVSNSVERGTHSRELGLAAKKVGPPQTSLSDSQVTTCQKVAQTAKEKRGRSTVGAVFGAVRKSILRAPAPARRSVPPGPQPAVPPVQPAPAVAPVQPALLGSLELQVVSVGSSVLPAEWGSSVLPAESDPLANHNAPPDPDPGPGGGPGPPPWNQKKLNQVAVDRLTTAFAYKQSKRSSRRWSQSSRRGSRRTLTVATVTLNAQLPKPIPLVYVLDRYLHMLCNSLTVTCHCSLDSGSASASLSSPNPVCLNCITYLRGSSRAKIGTLIPAVLIWWFVWDNKRWREVVASEDSTAGSPASPDSSASQSPSTLTVGTNKTLTLSLSPSNRLYPHYCQYGGYIPLPYSALQGCFVFFLLFSLVLDMVRGLAGRCSRTAEAWGILFISVKGHLAEVLEAAECDYHVTRGAGDGAGLNWALLCESLTNMLIGVALGIGLGWGDAIFVPTVPKLSNMSKREVSGGDLMSESDCHSAGWVTRLTAALRLSRCPAGAIRLAENILEKFSSSLSRLNTVTTRFLPSPILPFLLKLHSNTQLVCNKLRNDARLVIHIVVLIIYTSSFLTRINHRAYSAAGQPPSAKWIWFAPLRFSDHSLASLVVLILYLCNAIRYQLNSVSGTLTLVSLGLKRE